MTSKFNFKKIIFICFLSVALVFAPVHTHKAGAWLEFAGQILRTVLDQIRDLINGIIMGMLKQMATQMLNNEMGSMIGGSSSQNAKFITDWKDYMYTQPQQNTDKFMNDYLSQVTKGRGSMTGYISNASGSLSGLLSENYEGVGNGSFNYGMAQSNPTYGKLIETAQAKGINLNGVAGSAGNWMQELIQGAKNATTENTGFKISYQGDPRQNLFENGYMKNLSQYTSSGAYIPAFQLRSEGIYYSELQKEKDVAKTKGQAYQGFKGTEQGGMITNPGSLIKDNMANVQDLGNKVLANAKNMPEVITSIVQQIITKSIQNGIGNAQRNIQREVQNVQNKSDQQTNTQVQQYGPGSLYGNTSGAQ